MKWIVIAIVGLILIWLDSNPAITNNQNILDSELAWIFHFMNSTLSVFAACGLMFHYFTLVTRQYVEIRKLAMTDSLTSLSNRHYMVEIASQSLIQAQRYYQPFSVLVCDLDHFKEINDEFGHDAGDEVLKHTSKLLSKYARKSDYVGRWGGEEFILFLPQTDMEGAYQLAERIRESLESSIIVFNNKVIKFTGSIGISSLEPSDTFETVISRADNALYKAKAEGRNRVHFKEAGMLDSLEKDSLNNEQVQN